MTVRREETKRSVPSQRFYNYFKAGARERDDNLRQDRRRDGFCFVSVDGENAFN